MQKTLNVKLKNLTTADEHEFNLLKLDDRRKIYRHQNDYKIVSIESDEDWTMFDDNTWIGDIVKTGKDIEKLNNFEYRLFLKLVKEHIHEPEDIAFTLSHSVRTKNMLMDGAEVWETVNLDNDKYFIYYPNLE